MRKRRLIKYTLLVSEILLAVYIAYLYANGYGDRAPLLVVVFAVLGIMLVRALTGKRDTQELAGVERVYASYLTGVFEDRPRLRRRLLLVLLDTVSREEHPPVPPRLSALVPECRTARERGVLLFLLARSRSQDGDPAGAEQDYRAAVETCPDFSSAWSNLGVLLQTDRRYEEAEACMLRALELDPENAVKHANLANLYVLCARTGEARTAAERAVELNPNLLEAYVALSMLFAIEGNKSEARRYGRKCAKLGADEKHLEHMQNALLRGDMRVLQPAESRMQLSSVGEKKAKKEAKLLRKKQKK